MPQDSYLARDSYLEIQSGHVTQACNLSTWEAISEAGRSGVQEVILNYIEFETSTGYVRPCLKKHKQPPKNHYHNKTKQTPKLILSNKNRMSKMTNRSTIWIRKSFFSSFKDISKILFLLLVKDISI